MKLGMTPVYSGIRELGALINWISTEFSTFARNVTSTLANLSFDDNFRSFKATVEIAAGTELAIPNRLKGGRIPSEWIVVDLQTEKSFPLIRGYTEWTSNFVYIKNHGPDKVIATIRFFE